MLSSIPKYLIKFMKIGQHPPTSIGGNLTHDEVQPAGEGASVMWQLEWLFQTPKEQE